MNEVTKKHEGTRKHERYYIAYGSNLSVEQMAFRCPTAEIVGTSKLDGWRLCFRRYATIEECENSYVPVLIWKITEDDEKSLDRYEGYPTGYYKRELEVEVTPTDEFGKPTGAKPTNITAMVYIMTDRFNDELPSRYYFGILRDGYKAFGFSERLLYQALGGSIKDW